MNAPPEPDFASAYRKRRSGDLAAAIEDYAQIARLEHATDEQRAKALRYSAELRYQQGDIPGLVDDCTRLIGLENPPVKQLADALHDRGTIRQRQGDYAGAIDDYNRCVDLKIQPAEQNANTLMQRGFLRQQQGDHTGAFNDYTRCIDLENRTEQHARAHLGRGGLYAVKNRLEQAVEDFECAVSLQRRYAGAYEALAQASAKFYHGVHPWADGEQRLVADAQAGPTPREPSIYSAAEGCDTAARLWRSGDFFGQPPCVLALLDLSEHLNRPLMLWRIIGSMAGSEHAETLAAWGRFVALTERLQQQVRVALTWLEQIEAGRIDLPSDALPGFAARTELLFGDPAGAADRLDAHFQAQEDTNQPIRLRDRLTLIRALEGYVAPEGDLAKVEWQAARQAIRDAQADGELIGEDLRAAVLVLCMTGFSEEESQEEDRAADLALAERLWPGCGNDGGMGYVGWWLANQHGDRQQAQVRLHDALRDEMQRTQAGQPGWFAPSDLPPLDQLDQAQQDRMRHEHRRDEVAWVLEQAWSSDDALREVCLGHPEVAAWLQAMVWDSTQPEHEPYKGRLYAWQLEGEALKHAREQQQNKKAEDLARDRKRLRGSLQTLAVEDGMQGPELIRHLALRLHNENMSDFGARWAQVIKLLHDQGRIATASAQYVLAYGLRCEAEDSKQSPAGKATRGVITMAVGLTGMMALGYAGLLTGLSAYAWGELSLAAQYRKPVSGGRASKDTYEEFLEKLDGAFDDAALQKLRRRALDELLG